MYDVVLAASTLAYLALVAVYLTRPFASFLHPATLYLAIHGFLFVLRPVFARIYDYDFVYRLFNFQPSVADKVTVIVAANVGMYAFVLASWRYANRLPTPSDAEDARALRTRLLRPLILAWVVLGPLAVWSSVTNWGRRAAEFDTLARSLSTGVQINLEGSGWFYDSALMLGPLAVLTVWTTRFRWYGWPPFALFLILQAGSGVRGPIVYAAMALMALWILEKRRNWPDLRVAVAALTVLVLFNAVVLDRGNSVREAFGGPSTTQISVTDGLDPLEQMDFANLEYFEYIVFAVPQRTGTYDYFAQNLQIFTEPVPRVLWDEKPVGAPIQFFSLWDYGRPIGMTGSMPGQGWLALGYPGVVIQCGLFGLMFGAFYVFFLQRRTGAAARLVYAFLLANLVLCIRDGTLLVFVRTLPFYLGPVLLVLLGARLFEPNAGRAMAGRVTSHITPAERRRALAAGQPFQNP